ncbi:phosphinothricin acetyltransferase [Butyrivibrio sp. INlla18]|uniref:GNAT family N-acetyltransferase n=1 Tax=Butyrivibrio sp. INlla18 TaxID=1520806 RepID=UPI00088ABAB3|nr:GNAT family N-acetyltransferase [Butyrivibrio sp. INlla18]SDA53909.1 phosphinothricin acetyltransferase [Butyrivibrio sp. INlla18]
MTYQIRIATPEDAKELLDIYRYYVENTAITFEYDVPSVEEFRGRIERVLKKFPYLVVEGDGKIYGYAYVSPFKERAAYQWAVETSIYVAKDARRDGLGRMLYEELEKRLKEMGILNLNACIGYPNGAEDEHLTYDSVKFHEKMGYSMVGEFHQCGYKFGRWYNMVWMEKLIGEHVNDPTCDR